MIGEELSIDWEVSGLADWLHTAREVGWPVLVPDAVRNRCVRITRILDRQSIAVLYKVHDGQKCEQDSNSYYGDRCEPFERVRSGYAITEI